LLHLFASLSKRGLLYAMHEVSSEDAWTFKIYPGGFMDLTKLSMQELEGKLGDLLLLSIAHGNNAVTAVLKPILLFFNKLLGSPINFKELEDFDVKEILGRSDKIIDLSKAAFGEKPTTPPEQTQPPVSTASLSILNMLKKTAAGKNMTQEDIVTGMVNKILSTYKHIKLGPVTVSADRTELAAGADVPYALYYLMIGNVYFTNLKPELSTQDDHSMLRGEISTMTSAYKNLGSKEYPAYVISKHLISAKNGQPAAVFKLAVKLKQSTADIEKALDQKSRDTSDTRGKEQEQYMSDVTIPKSKQKVQKRLEERLKEEAKLKGLQGTERAKYVEKRLNEYLKKVEERTAYEAKLQNEAKEQGLTGTDAKNYVTRRMFQYDADTDKPKTGLPSAKLWEQLAEILAVEPDWKTRRGPKNKSQISWLYNIVKLNVKEDPSLLEDPDRLVELIKKYVDKMGDAELQRAVTNYMQRDSVTDNTVIEFTLPEKADTTDKRKEQGRGNLMKTLCLGMELIRRRYGIQDSEGIIRDALGDIADAIVNVRAFLRKAVGSGSPSNAIAECDAIDAAIQKNNIYMAQEHLQKLMGYLRTYKVDNSKLPGLDTLVNLFTEMNQWSSEIYGVTQVQKLSALVEQADKFGMTPAVRNSIAAETKKVLTSLDLVATPGKKTGLSEDSFNRALDNVNAYSTTPTREVSNIEDIREERAHAEALLKNVSVGKENIKVDYIGGDFAKNIGILTDLKKFLTSRGLIRTVVADDDPILILLQKSFETSAEDINAVPVRIENADEKLEPSMSDEDDVTQEAAEGTISAEEAKLELLDVLNHTMSVFPDTPEIKQSLDGIKAYVDNFIASIPAEGVSRTDLKNTQKFIFKQLEEAMSHSAAQKQYKETFPETKTQE